MCFSVAISEQCTQRTAACPHEVLRDGAENSQVLFFLLPHPPGKTALILTFGGRGRGGSLSTQPWQPALPRCLLGVVVAFSDTAVLAVAGDNQGTAGALGFSCSETAQRLLSIPTWSGLAGIFQFLFTASPSRRIPMETKTKLALFG